MQMLKRVLGLGVMASLLTSLLPHGTAFAAEAPETYSKLPPIAVEYWDANGFFRVLNMELLVAFPTNTSVKKDKADQIASRLAALGWEDLNRKNPANMVKSVALEVLRADPKTSDAKEVLVQKMLLR